ncbi:MAG: Flp pilus assembly complex ATPase component TadA [Phycisphaerales bacterium]|nr:Flp pilus assembly complex ATPase component TadA [Phycisphaerales bacterium]
MSPPVGQPGSAASASTAARLPIGELLVRQGRITREQLAEALEAQTSHGHSKLLGEVLVELGFVSEAVIMECLAASYGVPFARVTPRIADPRVIDRLPREFIDSHCVLPLFCVEGSLTVAVCEPANLFLVEEIERLSGCRAQVVVSTAQDIRATLQAYLPTANVFVIDDIYENVDVREFKVSEKQSFDLGDIEELSGQSPVVKLVNYIFYQAIQDRASDIHIEPEDHRCRVRFRVDGRLATKLMPPHQMLPAVVSRIKIMASMDISERRLPQDGDIHVAIDGRPVDLRVSTMPGKFGEKVVIRIIDNRNAILTIEKMGMRPEMVGTWRKLINMSNGMVLVTGPTGSGKSTTLYSALMEISSDDINISTVENPVEAQIPGVNQFQVNDKAGFTFASALRALLRQDPDVLMVGEVRDLETATIATQAALTGHLILSTLHTNDAISAVTRLTNMGIEPYLVAAMLRGVLAQRLVRKICPHCKEEYEPDTQERVTVESAASAITRLFRGAGCARCRASGYAGRLGIFELFVPTEAVLEQISGGATLQELRTLANVIGHKGLRDDGLAKAAVGLTTVDEVIRASST